MSPQQWLNRLRLRPRVSRLQVVLFTRQLASMLGSGVTLMTALNVLGQQSESPEFQRVVVKVSEMVNSGIRFSVALSEHPHAFSRIYCVMVQIGEHTGGLDDMLDRLGDWMERDENLRMRISKALTYPAFVCGLAVLLTLGLFYTVVPSFLNIFQEMGVELPLPTRIVKFVADSLTSPSSWLVGSSALCGGYYLVAMHLTRPGAWVEPYRLMLKVPVLGSMLQFGALARLTGTLGVLLESGMDLPKAVRMSVLASAQPIWEADLEALTDSIKQGNPLSEHLSLRDDLYPSALTQMILAGEESAQLAELTTRAGAYYEVELGFHIDTLSSVMEPVLMAGVSLVVGSIVIALFLPLYGFLSNLGMG
jgi:type IV pilus assembly protein PilC